MQRILSGAAPRLAYVGFLRDHQKDVLASIESTVFAHWDNLPTSPPKQRAREDSTINVTGLQLLSCDSAGRPGFPEHVFSKFVPGTNQHKKMTEIKEAFLREFPQGTAGSGSGATQPPGGTRPRASGQCDFTIDEGKEPLSIEREVDLSSLAPPDPSERIVALSKASTWYYHLLVGVFVQCLSVQIHCYTEMFEECVLLRTAGPVHFQGSMAVLPSLWTKTWTYGSATREAMP